MRITALLQQHREVITQVTALSKKDRHDSDIQSALRSQLTNRFRQGGLHHLQKGELYRSLRVLSLPQACQAIKRLAPAGITGTVAK